MYLALTTSSSSCCRLLRFAPDLAAPRGDEGRLSKGAQPPPSSAGRLWDAGASSSPGLPCSAAMRLLGTRPRFRGDSVGASAASAAGAGSDRLASTAFGTTSTAASCTAAGPGAAAVCAASSGSAVCSEAVPRDRALGLALAVATDLAGTRAARLVCSAAEAALAGTLIWVGGCTFAVNSACCVSGAAALARATAGFPCFAGCASSAARLRFCAGSATCAAAARPCLPFGAAAGGSADGALFRFPPPRSSAAACFSRGVGASTGGL